MLTFKDFLKISDDEKAKRFKELSEHDQFLWRINSPLKCHVIKNSELSDDELQWVIEQRKKLLEEGKITQEQYDTLNK